MRQVRSSLESWRNHTTVTSQFVLLSVLVQSAMAARVLFHTRPYIDPDALLFHYSGQVFASGGLPYQDVWDIKPPVIHEIAGLIALIVGGDPYWINVVSIGLTSTAFVVTVWLIAIFVLNWTHDPRAAITAGSIPFLLPEFYLFASRGLRPKLFVIVTGLIALWLYDNDRIVLSGGVAALCAGFWQFGAFFPIAILAHAVVNRQWRNVACLAAGGSIVTAIVLLPFVITDTMGILLQQVVVAPFAVSETTTLLDRLLKGGRLLLFTAPVVAIGAVAALGSPLDEASPWWVAPGMAWFAVQIWFLDLDAAPDLLVGLVFVAFGIGLVVNRLPLVRQWQALLGLGIIGVMMTSHALMTGTFAVGSYDPGLQTLVHNYWTGEMPQGCHLRVSELERIYIKTVGRACDISAF